MFSPSELTMANNKQIIVLGDIELGAGNLTDDFISDKALSELILSLSQKEGEIDLVLNGDTFDFLKCPSQLNPTHYPRHITTEISVQKLKLIYSAHQPIFEAWKQFVAQPGKKIFFILGNHDQDLIYPEVQKEIERLLGSSERVIFPGIKYEQPGLHVEHGHQYDFLFSVNFENLFLKHKGQSILNFPFVTFGLISTYMTMKEEHPFLERIFPRPELLTHHRVVARQFSRHTFGYFFKSLIYYPFRFYSDPTYSFPRNMFRELYTRIRTFHWDVDNITALFMKKSPDRQHLVVLGHIHEKRIAHSKNQVIIHPGSWRDEYDFNAKTRELVPRQKRYVHITGTGDELEYMIIDVPHTRRILYFDEVIKDEFKHIAMAAAAEGFSLRVKV